MKKELKYIECGKIINTHGCHGGLKVEPWCNSPEDFLSFKKVYLNENGTYSAFKIKKASVFKQFIVLEVDGVSDMDTAMALKNKIFFTDRNDFSLEEGEFFIADMIGLDVIDNENGTVYGKLVDIINRGASDIYVVQTKNGEKMIPAVDEFVIKIDINSGVYVNVIPGLLD